METTFTLVETMLVEIYFMESESVKTVLEKTTLAETVLFEIALVGEYLQYSITKRTRSCVRSVNLSDHVILIVSGSIITPGRRE